MVYKLNFIALLDAKSVEELVNDLNEVRHHENVVNDWKDGQTLLNREDGLVEVYERIKDI